MDFEIVVRRAWVRACTHTLIRDNDPDFTRHRADRRGAVKKMLRVWQAGTPPGAPWPRRYLGRIHVCGGGPVRSQLTAVLRHAARIAREEGDSGRVARRRLKALLRRHL